MFLFITNENLSFGEEKIVTLKFAKEKAFYTNVGSDKWASAGMAINTLQKIVSVFDCDLSGTKNTNYIVDIYYR